MAAAAVPGYWATAAAAKSIQTYLHATSDQHTCHAAFCLWSPESSADPSVLLPLAVSLVWGVLGVLCVVFAIALLLFRARVVSNTLRFLTLVAFILLLTFWTFALSLSGINGLLLLTGATTRVPFPQPGLATILSFASLRIVGIIRLARRAAQRRV